MVYHNISTYYHIVPLVGDDMAGDAAGPAVEGHALQQGVHAPILYYNIK